MSCQEVSPEDPAAPFMAEDLVRRIAHQVATGDAVSIQLESASEGVKWHLSGGLKVALSEYLDGRTKLAAALVSELGWLDRQNDRRT